MPDSTRKKANAKKFTIAWHPAATVQTEGARVLPALLNHFFEHGDRVVRPRTSPKRLHEFRLEAKRVRYTLELFEPLYGGTIKPHIEAIRNVQQTLGQLNDCEATLDLLKDTGAEIKPEWSEAITQRRDKKRGEFTKLWLEEYTDPTRRESLIAKL